VRTAQALGAQPAQAGAAYLADRGGLPMVETLFAQQAKWAVRNPLDPLLAIAKQAGFTQQTFDACINNKDQLKKVQQVRDRASQKFKIKRRRPSSSTASFTRAGCRWKSSTRQSSPISRPEQDAFAEGAAGVGSHVAINKRPKKWDGRFATGFYNLELPTIRSAGRLPKRPAQESKS
jgi:hypothetical protein